MVWSCPATQVATILCVNLCVYLEGFACFWRGGEGGGGGGGGGGVKEAPAL